MSKKRQDSWTNDEDVMLAEIVLRHIRNGKTQLEAFKEAGSKLSRTAAACGYRWNATLRKRYVEGIQIAKRNSSLKQAETETINGIPKGDTSIDHAINLLKNLKSKSEKHSLQLDERNELEKLREENNRLSEKLKRYEEALYEIHNIWNWAKNEKEH